MFSEKNITKFIILTPIITVILITFFTSYFFIQTQNSYFEEESIRIENEYILKQKYILKKEIDSILNYINYSVKNNKSRNEKEIKKEILKYIETIRYQKDGYLWVHDTSYYLRAHPFRKNSIDTNDIHLEDAMGTKITKRFIDETIKKPNGVFIEYFWKKPRNVHFSQKLGFFKLYKKYSWVIGAGLYMDNIENYIVKNKKLLEQRINKYIRFVLIVSFLVIITIGFLSFVVSNRVSRVFTEYKQSVKRKELLLSELNKNLKEKVSKAIIEVKNKDRAMLHQSRLARMGVMLSLIAHQWRQPLTKISAILMQLETAIKFSKADDKLALETINQSNQLLFYMSNTIDDFRNFFKPDKKKVDFYVNDSINEAISLVQASINNFNIILKQDMQENPMIHGYKREFAQVILNLITNAKDILHQREIKNPIITVCVTIVNKEIIITVSDNARGIKDEIIDLIFEPYFTTKESSKGTGLGLYMSKMIIEKNMDGELSVKNDNLGAVFTISLKV